MDDVDDGVSEGGDCVDSSMAGVYVLTHRPLLPVSGSAFCFPWFLGFPRWGGSASGVLGCWALAWASWGCFGLEWGGALLWFGLGVVVPGGVLRLLLVLFGPFGPLCPCGGFLS